MSTSNGDQFQRLLFVASCEVKTDPELPARGSACGRGSWSVSLSFSDLETSAYGSTVKLPIGPAQLPVSAQVE